MELITHSSKTDKILLIYKNHFKLISLKTLYEYLQNLELNQKFQQALSIVNILFENKKLRLAGINDFKFQQSIITITYLILRREISKSLTG